MLEYRCFTHVTGEVTGFRNRKSNEKVQDEASSDVHLNPVKMLLFFKC
jgi:hypothetical protein